MLHSHADRVTISNFVFFFFFNGIKVFSAEHFLWCNVIQSIKTTVLCLRLLRFEITWVELILHRTPQRINILGVLKKAR